MRYGKILIALVILALWAMPAEAGSDLKIGTSGAQHLRIPVGSRGTAMGGSAVAYTSGIDALFWNPAGAADILGTDVLVSRRKYIADIDIDYVVGAQQVGDAGVIAVTAKILSMDDEMVTTVDQPDGTGQTFGSSFSVVGLSYARTLTDRVDLGASGNFVYEKIADQTATGLAFDIGVRYDPGWNNLVFGAVIKNLGPKMRYDGRGFNWDTRTGDDPNSLPHTTRTESASFEIPSYVQIGAAYKLYEQEKSVVHVTSAFQSNNFSEDEYQLGAEYGLDGKFFLRGGYSISDQENYIYGFSFGAGVALDIGDTAVNFDYAWAESDFFDNTQYFTFQVGF
jgi:hypothetical protein